MIDLTDLYKEILESENTTLPALKEVSEPNDNAKNIIKKRTKVIINPPLKEDNNTLKEIVNKIIKTRSSD